jgi:hypothetical protein
MSVEEHKTPWGEATRHRIRASRNTNVPFNEGLTVPARLATSRRYNNVDQACYPYAQQGSVGDGTQDAMQGELAFTCDSFNTDNDQIASGLGSLHTAVTTTTANMTERELQQCRVLGVLRTSAKEVAHDDKHFGSSPTQPLSVQVSGKATIAAHTGKHHIRHGETVMATMQNILKVKTTPARRDGEGVGRGGGATPESYEPHLTTPEGVRKWSVRTESAGRLQMSEQHAHTVSTGILAYDDDEASRAKSYQPAELERFIVCLQKLDNALQKHAASGHVDDDVEEEEEQGQYQAISIAAGSASASAPSVPVAMPVQVEEQVDEALGRPPTTIEHAIIADLVSAAAAYHYTLGVPIGVALSDTAPGKPLTVLLGGTGRYV